MYHINMKLEFDAPCRPEDLPGNLEKLANHHRSGQETRFIIVQQTPDDTLAIINVSPVIKHRDMLFRYSDRTHKGQHSHFDEELRTLLGDSIIGGGIISQNEIRWRSPGCMQILKYDRPADETKADALLSELREKFDAWLSTMPE